MEMQEKCHKPHHTWLHADTNPDVKKKEATPNREQDNPPSVLATNSSQSGGRQVLLMTCQNQVISPNGLVTQARALLDLASSTSFITERLAQHLQLPRRRRDMNVCGVGGMHTQLQSRGKVELSISGLGHGQKRMNLDSIVLPKVTSDLPTYPVLFQKEWKHLANLTLADPEFGTSGRIDLL